MRPLPTRRVPLLRWGFVFLSCPTALSDDEREQVVRCAIEAHFDDQQRVDFDLRGMAGSVRATSEATSLGGFVGRRFEAQLITEKGEVKLQLLVTEKQLQEAAAEMIEA